LDKKVFEDLSAAMTGYNNGHDDVRKLKEHLSLVAEDDAPSSSGLGSFWATLTFGWYTPVLLSIKNKLNAGLAPNIEDDPSIPKLPKEDCVVHVDKTFNTYWKQELSDQTNKEPSVTRALWKAFAAPFVFSGALSFVANVTQYASASVIDIIVPYLSDPSSTFGYGLSISVFLFVALVLSSLTNRHSYYIGVRVSNRVRTALMYAIFEKALKIDSTYYVDHPVGQVTNLMSVDVNNVSLFVEYAIQIFGAVVSITMAIYMLWQQLGYSSLAGVAVLIISIPMTTKTVGWMMSFMKKVMEARDERVSCNQEVFSNMKIVKFQAWESPFLEKNERFREHEVNELWQFKVANAVAGIVFISTPMIVTLSSFGVFVTIAGHELNAATALTVFTLFNLLKMPLMTLPFLANIGAESKVALDRIQDYLLAPDIIRPKRISDGRTAVDIHDGSFSYDKVTKAGKGTSMNEQDPLLLSEEGGYGATASNSLSVALKNINFNCTAGEFIAVVGGVGDGKSTLLKAILGEVQTISGGEVSVGGDIAYFSQDPFIMNDTVEGNILFGKRESVIDNKLYRMAIQSSCLTPDLKEWSGGDQYEIGEKGTGLSGGQKARVAIGRAVYRDADITLLDDCLSAVDAHVGRALFDKCIVEVLLDRAQTRSGQRKRTVILVTNALHYLNHPALDRILVMKDGLLVESGSYKELTSRDSYFKSLMGTSGESSTNELMIEDGELDDEEDDYFDTDKIFEEELEEDLENMIAGFGLPADEQRRSSILAIPSRASRASSSRISLRHSSARQSTSRKSSRKSVSSRSSVVSSGPAELMTDEGGQTGKVDLEVYKIWAEAAGGYWVTIPIILVFVAPQLTDILARYWVTSVWALSEGSNSKLYYLGIYALILASNIILGVFNSIVPPIFGLRASKKFYSNMLSTLLQAPMSFFDTTPTGRIINRFSKDINTADETLVSNFTAFLGSVFNILSSLVIILVASPNVIFVLPFLFKYYHTQYEHFGQSNRELQRIDSAARSPVYALFGEALHGYSTIRAFEAEPALMHRMSKMIDHQQHAGYLMKTAKPWIGIRLEFVGTLLVFIGTLSFVLMKHWSEEMDDSTASFFGLALSYLFTISNFLMYAVRAASDFEASMVSVERIREYSELALEAPHEIPADKMLDNAWPCKGAVEFKDVKLRYRPELPLVLKGLDLKIPPKAKVGIVGRTGCGKSTLMTGLMRLVELDGGKIVLDGIDIKGVGLKRLRSSIAIIPQDPVLFSGTVQSNLDPFNKHSEGRIIDVLTRVGLYSSNAEGAIQSLMHIVEQDGKNFSSGQRQLLVIARALLDDASVVILDEATSSIDPETDARIQRIFREDFANATTLTVAHRINTIMDSTHILALADGKAEEFDSPSALLKKGGLFKDLVDAWEKEQ
jgi:ABC-type multidrug transport system fused ATPase/permease subunit